MLHLTGVALHQDQYPTYEQYPFNLPIFNQTVPLDGDSAIVPIIVGETAQAISISKALLEKHHIFITGFGFPVVPEGTARLCIQASAALSEEDITQACNAIAEELESATD